MLARSIKLQDHPFIYNSFLKSYVRSALERCTLPDMIQQMPRDFFFSHYKLVLQALLNHTAVRFIVACERNNDNIIYGWAAAIKGEALFYVYVKHDYRGQGIATHLLKQLDIQPGDSIDVAHYTPQGGGLLKALNINIVDKRAPANI